LKKFQLLILSDFVILSEAHLENLGNGPRGVNL